MRRFVLVGFSMLLGSACSTKGGQTAFDRAFEQAKKTNGLESAVVVSRPSGEALQTNVQRVSDPLPPEGLTLTKKVPDSLSPRVLARILRRKVSRLKYCLMESGVGGRSGKVLLTLTINASGYVESVDVKAPAFRDTSLPSCIRKTVELWRFPKFRKGRVTHTYPIIFKGR